ncbi:MULTISPECIES: alpha/beta hydrolase [unclassified Nocardioides]|uniref:alpha/beta hydrolase n=1 Tax=unclassified Nocardioides TaxID=2615069 RepID=UPI0006FF159C|nr:MULTISPECIES: alpha/beta hydrolase [unclassified Nocardioides]KRA28182.1 alpha/beta hydrolase [Nocardioides sp. Root614]KRA86156.1 alpha/beta hydrolase [Nocardioides sp. Root682]
MPVDPQLAPLLSLIAAGTPLSELSPTEARDSFRKLTVDFRPPGTMAEVASVTDDKVAGGEGSLAARVYRPEVTGPVPTVVLFHGGGFVIGDLDTHEAMARSICRDTQSVVVAVDYRLAPEAKFPAAAEDAIAAVRDIQSRLSEYGGSEVIAVAGDSAGGNLSAVAAQHVPGIAAQLLVYPATAIVGDFPSREENATGYFLDADTLLWFLTQFSAEGMDLADPRIAPLHGDLAGQPPAVVITAEFDPLRDEGIAYAEALVAAGVQVHQHTYPGLIHGFFDMGPWSTACQQAIDESIALFASLLRP